MLKLLRFAAAEQDCTNALLIDPTYTKALFRRATARVKLDKLQDAVDGRYNYCRCILIIVGWVVNIRFLLQTKHFQKVLHFRMKLDTNLKLNY